MRGIIFDLDGVICHTDRYHYEAWHKLADRLGLAFDEEMNRRLRGVSRLESLERILEANHRENEYSKEEKASLAAEKNKTYRELLVRLSPCDVLGEVYRTLDGLREMGMKLAIGSSSRNAGFILERLGLGDYFDAVVDGNGISRSKPDPEVFLQAANRLGLLPAECFVVEDSEAGIKAAASGGFTSIAIGEAVKDENAEYRIKRFGEIIRIVYGVRMRKQIKYIDGYQFEETAFHGQELAKTETIMALGNGYLGLRSSAEESYAGQCRGMFIAGSFNRFDENEVTELPNCADMIGTDIWLAGERIDLSRGKVTHYGKRLDLKKGLLTRRACWTISGRKYALAYERFVSQNDMHLIGQKIDIHVRQDVTVRLVTGINGRMTNSGVQHFSEGDKRFLDGKYIQMTAQTTQSRIQVFYTAGIRVLVDGAEVNAEPELLMDRRRILLGYSVSLKAGKRLTIEKVMDIRTDRDADNEGIGFEAVRLKALDGIREKDAKGYEVLLAESAEALDRKLWSKAPVRIRSNGCFDQLAIHFAQYHMHIMTPAHDSRMNIGAKGLSGEGYKGHTFWDTEIFALPYFLFSNPQTAQKLVEYRFRTLSGARRKARDNGYEGAQFPWESAWLDDGEVTPEWGPADVVTGLPLKIESGLIEQHITSDVAYGVWQYYNATGDEQFMIDCGYELIFDTAIFWGSRLEQKEDGKYHILDVMGPDEFKEHVDDNAFTNYMAWWNMRTAIGCYDRIKERQAEVYGRLNEKLRLDACMPQLRLKAGSIYLPVPGSDNILPQDRTYLTLKDIDLEKYKNGNYGSLYKDYNSRQISQIQVSKQADVLLLFLLMEKQFAPEIRKASFAYYEPRTIHDSSLSFSSHAVLACDMEQEELGYSFFERACRIDLGQDMGSCNDGIHAAAAAGIWQSAVFGFGGVRMTDGELRVIPHLPKAWNSLDFVLYWKGQRLEIHADRRKVVIDNVTNLVPTEVFVVDERLYFDGAGKRKTVTKQIG